MTIAFASVRQRLSVRSVHMDGCEIICVSGVECITQWRDKGKKNRSENFYSCPNCRRKCSFVLKSGKHLTGEARKEYFKKFKDKAAQKQCRLWRRGKCKRGQTCLFKHGKVET